MLTGMRNDPFHSNLRALDWLNAVLVAAQTAFGPFLAAALSERGWTPASIGLALTGGGLAALLVQAPAGDLVDRISSKHAFLGSAIVLVFVSSLILGLRSDFASLFLATALQGIGESMIGVGIGAVSLAWSDRKRSARGSGVINTSLQSVR